MHRRTLGANYTAPAISERPRGTLFSVATGEASRMIVAPNESTELQCFQQLKLRLTFAPVLSFLAEGGPEFKAHQDQSKIPPSPEQYAGVNPNAINGLV